jgi:hypothetical protein
VAPFEAAQQGHGSVGSNIAAVANCYREQLMPSPRAGSGIVHGYPFEDAADAKIVAHLVGLLQRMD